MERSEIKPFIAKRVAKELKDKLVEIRDQKQAEAVEE